MRPDGRGKRFWDKATWFKSSNPSTSRDLHFSTALWRPWNRRQEDTGEKHGVLFWCCFEWVKYIRIWGSEVFNQILGVPHDSWVSCASCCKISPFHFCPFLSNPHVCYPKNPCLSKICRSIRCSTSMSWSNRRTWPKRCRR